jgi:hypothetical protein
MLTIEPTQSQPAERQAWEKPVLRTVDLVAEQVLSLGCKVAGGNGTAKGGIDCVAGNCAGDYGS